MRILMVMNSTYTLSLVRRLSLSVRSGSCSQGGSPTRGPTGEPDGFDFNF